MDFGFTEEQERLRKELHDFYINEFPEDVNPQNQVGEKTQPFWRAMERKAGEKGYLTPGWSKESGGLGLGSIEQGIVYEFWGSVNIRWPNFSGQRLAGPALHLFDTEEQKKKFLPAISQKEVI